MNQGLESLVIFVLTLLIGWVSGLFTSLKRKPRLAIELIPGPTFSCTFATGDYYRTYQVHRTAIALYLHVANVGNAPSSIKDIEVGYHWNIEPFSVAWIKYGLGWFWIKKQTIALQDFQYKVGEQVKIFPFLNQRSGVSLSSVDTYLEIGKSVNGVVYFEQEESWGGNHPKAVNGKASMLVRAVDVFGRKYERKFAVPVVSLDEAVKYNPAFGSTLIELRKHREQTQANTSQESESS